MSVLIDLDAGPAPRPVVRSNRRYGALAVTALLVALLGGAVPAAVTRELVPVLQSRGRPVSTGLLTGAALYTQRAGPADGLSQIEARPLAPGGPSWTAFVPAAGSGLVLDDSGTVLVVAAGDAGATFLDAATGRERWRADGGVTVRVVGGRAAEWAPGLDSDPGRLRMRDLATGRPLWSRPAATFAVDAAHRRVVTLEATGRAAVYAASDGRVLTGPRDLGVAWEAGLPEPYAPAEVLDDRVVVMGPDLVAAYRLDGLTPLWRTRVEAAVLVQRCGGQVCVLTSGGLTVLDPATGATGWRSTRWRGIAEDGSTLLDEGGRATRVDFATGRVERELGRGLVVGGLLLRDDGERTSVVRFGDGRTLGALPRQSLDACTAGGGHLACATDATTMTVWRTG